MLRFGSEGGRESQGDPKWNFFVASTLTKGYNKWYICERGEYLFKKGMDKRNFRFEARMIRYDHGYGRYEYFKPVDSDWGPASIAVLADGSEIKKRG